MDVSPYISAIQSLDGQNPGDKYKGLHTIVAQIIENDQEKTEFIKTGITDRIQPALLPHLRILVGNKLKLNDAVVEALKSDDVTIIKQALSAKWFFNVNNDLIRVDYFMKNVIPFISLRTRLELIKTLAHCLSREPKKADDFFGNFVDLYGLEQALPLIASCSEKYIFDAVLQRRIVLPSRILGALYRKYPLLVIRYLQLGNEENEANKEERKIHKINLENYINFLPILVKHHTQEFIELYESLPNYHNNLSLGSTRAEFFLKNATDVLIKKPRQLLDLLPLKLVSNKLSTQQFETMFENYFPKQVNDFYIYDMIKNLKYYSQENKFDLLMEKYKLIYGKNLLDNKNVLDCTEFFKLLPLELKKEYGKKLAEPYVGKPEYYDHVEYSPPQDCIPMLKERIVKISSVQRTRWIQNMITSCAIYDSKENLLDVLRYYYTRHKNERADVLHEVLQTLIGQFDIKLLDKTHWQILKDILQRAYVKGDLFNIGEYLYTPLFKGALQYFLKQCKEDTVDNETMQFLDKLVGIIIECYLEHKMKLEFLDDCALELEGICLEKFLQAIPLKYPESHDVWSKLGNKLILVSYLVKSIHKFNVRNFSVESKKKKKYNTGSIDSDSESKAVKQSKYKLRDYPWLMKFAADLLKDSQTCKDCREKKMHLEHRRTLRHHDPKLYQSFIDNSPDIINDVESYDALYILKHDGSKVLAKWKMYLNACREKLKFNCKSVKQFVVATKWHQDIPVKFIDQCLLEIDEKGSTLVLGILLEGEVFGRVIEPYLPKNKKIDLEDENAKKTYEITSSLPKAMNFTNPPVSFDVIVSFCQGDYVSLASHTLTNVAQRVPISRVMAFANQLVDKPISVKKLGIRLVFQVASKTESREFLTRMWSSETNTSIREIIANMIFNVFKQTPSAKTWELIKICINGLTSNDQTVFEILSDVTSVDKNFVTLYIQEFLKKVDGFGKDDLDEQTKSKFICSMVTKIDENIMHLLPENLATDIVKRQFFDYSTRFRMDVYLFSDPSKFEERLKTFMEIVREKFKEFNKPHPERPRYYPANYQLRCFFREIIRKVVQMDKSEMNAQLINSSLNLLSMTLKLYQEPLIFIWLEVIRDYLNSSTPKEFGTVCVVNVARLVKEFGSEMILIDIITLIDELLRDVYMFKKMNHQELKLSVIEGLMEKDAHLGALIGIKLLCRYEIGSYDSRYDSFIKTWRGMEEPVVQAALSELVNEVHDSYL